MEDGPSSTFTLADRLDLLRRREAAWDRLQWTSVQIIPLHDGVWELCGGVLAQARSRNELCFTRLPSQIRGITQNDWELRLPMVVGDFGMDPSLDLLVVVERGVYVTCSKCVYCSVYQSASTAAVTTYTSCNFRQAAPILRRQLCPHYLIKQPGPTVYSPSRYPMNTLVLCLGTLTATVATLSSGIGRLAKLR